MPSITNSSGTGDDDDFCDVVHVEQRGTPAQESIVVSTAHAAVEATSSSAANSQKSDKQTKRLGWKSFVALQQHGVTNSLESRTNVTESQLSLRIEYDCLQ